MIDNLKIINRLLNFTNPNDFYMLYILKRKKDQPEGERNNHQSVRTIRTYCIKSVEHLESRYDEIKMMCEMFKARAYIHVQKQNHTDISLNMMVALAQRIQDGNHQQQSLFDSVVGQIKTHEKRWVVDVDTKDMVELGEIGHTINNLCTPLGPNKIIEIIPTKSGSHLITHRFNTQEFVKYYPDIDIQKKNPTLLYLPDSLK
jgi:hypothetical protein